jgi:hypothetical protein
VPEAVLVTPLNVKEPHVATAKEPVLELLIVKFKVKKLSQPFAFTKVSR